MKFMKLLLAISIVSSAATANAQDKPAKQSADVVVEGKNASVVVLEKQLKTLQAELEKVRAEAVLRAQQLQAKEQALAEGEKQIASVRRDALLAHEQFERAQKAAAESMMQADKAKAEAEKARLSQELGIGQFKAMLQLVEKKQGPEHAYSQQLKVQLMKLESELARMSQEYGPQHPKVVQTKKEVEAVQSQLQKVDPEVTTGSDKLSPRRDNSAGKVTNLGELIAEAEMNNFLTNPEKMAKLQGRIADETVKAQLSALNASRAAAERVRALYEQQLVSRQELAEQDNAVAMQLRRTQEMLEMQKRLLSAENVARSPVVAGRNVKADNSAERFDRLEQKLDRIASLLEKLVETKE